jgi:DNA-binding GntR family transcriptional regulator
MSDQAEAPRKTAMKRVYEMVRDGISTGAFQVGERLTEGALADRLQVSRTPVREALQRLASEGFVDLSPHVGALVKDWSARDAREVYQVRAQLESMAAWSAAANARPEDIPRLAGSCDEMEALARSDPLDIAAIAASNRAFHLEILRLAGNRRLAEIARNLMDLALLIRTTGRFGRERILQSAADHRRLVEAIGKADPRWAEAIMRSHILAAAGMFVEPAGAVRADRDIPAAHRSGRSTNRSGTA